MKTKVFLLLSVILLLLSACAGSSKRTTGTRILLWHMWNGPDEAALDNLLARFQEIYPDISVISIRFDADELQEQFAITTERGLGPDLLIGSQLWTPALAQQNLIRPVEELGLDLSTYQADVLDTLRIDGTLYGVPLALQTSALYYNKTLVAEPAATLDKLLEDASNGHGVAVSTRFEDAFWGVQTFGGRLLDEQGRVVLNQGGFANWLDWLLDAQNVPNVVLSNDPAELRSLFEEGTLAYYVGPSSELLRLQDALGADALGVATLPAGPNDSAGPFLTVEPFFLSTASSQAQAERAVLLARFLSNAEQQRRLAQQTGRIPANPQVRINRRIAPAVASFLDQSRTAVPLRLIPQMFQAIAQGQEAYAQVLEGLAPPADVAQELTARVNDANGLETVAVSGPEACTVLGRVALWHTWQGKAADALAAALDSYTQQCAGLEIELRNLAPEQAFPLYREALRAGQGPDLVLLPNRLLSQLTAQELVLSLNDRVSSDFLQRYLPAVPETMRVQGDLYGLPLTLDTFALYYDSRAVSEPPVDLGELLAQISPDQQFAMAYQPFAAAQWGATAFGGRPFDADGNLTIDTDGYAEWLEWLDAAKEQPGFRLVRSVAEARELFRREQVAYFVGPRQALEWVEAELGRGIVQVAPLPAGPENAAGPLLESDGLMLSPAATNGQAALAVAEYLTSAESQQILLEAARLIPANATVAAPDALPVVAAFQAQAASAIAAPNRQETDTVFSIGGIIYEKMATADDPAEEADIAATLADFAAYFQRTHSPSPEQLACEHSGPLILWHSLNSAEAQALALIVEEFARACPDVALTARFIPRAELPSRLLAASTTDAAGSDPAAGEETAGEETAGDAQPGDSRREEPPHLILASHTLLSPLSAERLLRPIDGTVSGDELIPFLPRALQAMRVADALYGLPFQGETTGLFYDLQRTPAAAESLFALFDSVAVTNALALDTSFAQGFWGALAFGGNPSLMSVEDPILGSSRLDLGQSSLPNWLNWIDTSQGRGGIFASPDAGVLQDLFTSGTAVYLTASSSALPALRQEMETDGALRVGVARLPSGPEGDALPFVEVEGFAFGAAVEESSLERSLAFALFATSGASQATFARETSRVPVNIQVRSLLADPAIATLMAQAERGVLLPAWAEAAVLLEGGEALFRAVLDEGQAPETAFAQFSEFLEEAPRPALPLDDTRPADTAE